MKNNSFPLSIIISTFFIAVFCSIKTINSILVAGAGDVSDTESGPMALLYVVSVIGALLPGIVFSKQNGRHFSGAVLFIVIWVTLFYIFTVVFIAPPFTSFMFFMILTLYYHLSQKWMVAFSLDSL